MKSEKDRKRSRGRNGKNKQINNDPQLTISSLSMEKMFRNNDETLYIT